LDEHAQSKHSKTGKECFGDAYDQYVEVAEYGPFFNPANIAQVEMRGCV